MTWINVNDAMPAPDKRVIATYVNSYGKRRMIIAHYVGHLDKIADTDDEGSIYDDETDEYYLPAGWYEQQENWGDYASIYVHEGEVTHWMPLPHPPADYERILDPCPANAACAATPATANAATQTAAPPTAPSGTNAPAGQPA